MKKNNLHIDTNSSNFPQPDIDVNDAWKEMEKLLDVMPNPVKLSTKKMIVKLVAKIVTSIAVVVTISAITFFCIQYLKKHTLTSKENSEIVLVQKCNLLKTNRNYMDYNRLKVSERLNIPMTKLKQHTQKDSSTYKNDPSLSKQILYGKSKVLTTSKLDEKNIKNAIVEQHEVKGKTDYSKSETKTEPNNFTVDDRNISTQEPKTTIEVQSKINMFSNENLLSVIESNSVSEQDTKTEYKSRNQLHQKLEKQKDAINKTDSIIQKKNVSRQPEQAAVFPKNSLRLNLKENITGGLQWNLPIQINNFADNFNKNIQYSQAYLMGIPSIWIAYHLGRKHSVILNLSPCILAYPMQSKLPYNGTTAASSDSTQTTGNSLYLYKTISASIGLDYSYQLVPNMYVGTGANYFYTYSATLKNVHNTMNGNIPVTNIDYNHINSTSTDWKYISSNNINCGLLIEYKINRISIGARLLLPLNSINGSIFTGIQGQSFIRWKFF